jgi:hypothetical protein
MSPSSTAAHSADTTQLLALLAPRHPASHHQLYHNLGRAATPKLGGDLPVYGMPCRRQTWLLPTDMHSLTMNAGASQHKQMAALAACACAPPSGTTHSLRLLRWPPAAEGLQMTPPRPPCRRLPPLQPAPNQWMVRVHARASAAGPSSGRHSSNPVTSCQSCSKRVAS